MYEFEPAIKPILLSFAIDEEVIDLDEKFLLHSDLRLKKKLYQILKSTNH